MMRDILTFGKNFDRVTKDDWFTLTGEYVSPVAGNEKAAVATKKYEFTNPLLRRISNRYNVVPVAFTQ